MPFRGPRGDRPRLGLSFVLLASVMLVLWIGGGASRADALGQLVSRGAAWLALIVAILFAPTPRFRDARPIFLLLLAALALALVQLVPLPPELWQALPGRAWLADAATLSNQPRRAWLADAATLSNQPQPWRPWSIVPGATINAASSLIVPIAVAVLAAGLNPAEHRRLPALLLGLVVASTLIALLQFSGAGFDNPLVNDTPGQVSALFANRNHFALFTAIGCLLAPVWAFQDGRRPHWRGPAALASTLLFALIILASGSRAGLMLGVMGLGIGLLLAQRGIRMELRRYPRWVLLALIAGVAGALVSVVLLSIAAGRAVSISRFFAVDPGQDMRTRGLPTVFAMIREYFPFGSGPGGFDPIFRIHEPLALLKLTYFNHAHNDYLEVALDAGLAGLVLLVTALLWWAWASVRVWRSGRTSRQDLPRLGSAVLLLVAVASVFDYPARTPMIMALIVLAAIWLGSAKETRSTSPLPQTD